VKAQTVCAVFVTYDPRPTFACHIVNVAAQVDHVVVIDNASGVETRKQLEEFERRPGFTVIRNPENLGIAVALNLGVKYALDGGYDWICTFDQDSQASDGFISNMLQTYEQSADPEQVALVAPTYVDKESQFRMPLKRDRNGQILTAMTSGSMVSMAAIRKLGLFDENLFMDAVDIEFSLRARRQGMSILQSPAVLLHSLGATSYHHLFGVRFGVTHHPAGRRYYMTRNRLRLLARYASDWPWMWRESRSILLDIVKIAFAEQDKWRKFRAIGAGFADACRGKLGKQVEL